METGKIENQEISNIFKELTLGTNLPDYLEPLIKEHSENKLIKLEEIEDPKNCCLNDIGISKKGFASILNIKTSLENMGGDIQEPTKILISSLDDCTNTIWFVHAFLLVNNLEQCALLDPENNYKKQILQASKSLDSQNLQGLQKKLLDTVTKCIEQPNSNSRFLNTELNAWIKILNH